LAVERVFTLFICLQPSAIRQPMQIGFCVLLCLSCVETAIGYQTTNANQLFISLIRFHTYPISNRAIGYQTADANRLLRAESLIHRLSKKSIALPPAAGREPRQTVFNSLYSLHVGTARSSPPWLDPVKPGGTPSSSSITCSPGRVSEILDPHLRGGTVLGWVHHEPGYQA
jgi:hypothetical protein